MIGGNILPHIVQVQRLVSDSDTTTGGAVDEFTVAYNKVAVRVMSKFSQWRFLFQTQTYFQTHEIFMGRTDIVIFPGWRLIWVDRGVTRTFLVIGSPLMGGTLQAMRIPCTEILVGEGCAE